MKNVLVLLDKFFYTNKLRFLKENSLWIVDKWSLLFIWLVNGWFQVPNSQIQIPVQIQVPQHHIQVSPHNEEENENHVSTVVLPTASEGLSILPN